MNREDYIDLYFEELDLGPRWRLRQTFGATLTDADSAAADEATDAVTKTAAEAADRPAASGRPAPAGSTGGPASEPQRPSRGDAFQSSREDSLRSSHGDFLRSQKNVANATLAPRVPATARPMAEAAATPDGIGGMDWETLETTIRACKACGLCRQRRQAVPGVGDRQADWLFIGEGPGADEDVQGEPFVGQAGKLLDNMLLAIGLRRGDNVYIANAVKCRPPNNRTPEAAEMAACKPYLERQIALLQPKLIVLLGKPAVHTILGCDDALGSLRGRLHRYGDIPVVVTYHPAYLLRTLHDKAKAWEDLCLARRTMRELNEAQG